MTILITIILIILCICSLITVVGVSVLGYLLLTKSYMKEAAQETHAPASSPYSSEQMERMRKQSEDEIKAFQELMNYSADVAYGIKRGDGNE